MSFEPLALSRLRRSALRLAVALALALTLLQATELSHLHNPLDPPGHCLLCKADTHAMPGAVLPEAEYSFAAAAPVPGPVPVPANGAALTPPARGPPART